jgi:hypothetical protein
MTNRSQALTDDQVERMELAVQELAKWGNAPALGITRNLEGKALAEKRRVLTASYAQMFEALVAMNMALDSKRSAEDIRQALEAGNLPPPM